MINLIFVCPGTLPLARNAWSHCVAGITLSPVDAKFVFVFVFLAVVRGIETRINRIMILVLNSLQEYHQKKS